MMQSNSRQAIWVICEFHFLVLIDTAPFSSKLSMMYEDAHVGGEQRGPIMKVMRQKSVHFPGRGREERIIILQTLFRKDLALELFELDLK